MKISGAVYLTLGILGLAAAVLATLVLLCAAWQVFGTSGTGFAIAAFLACAGLALHHRASR